MLYIALLARSGFARLTTITVILLVILFYRILPPPNLLTAPLTDSVEACLLPHILIWNPLQQFKVFFSHGLQCPQIECRRYVQFHRWNMGQSISHGPRLLHDMNNMVLLVPAVYICTNGHEVISTDPHVLHYFIQQEFIPFILFHRSGITRELARAVISLSIEGLSFKAVEHFIMYRRIDYITSLQMKVQCIPMHRNIILHSCTSIVSLHLPYPSNDLLTKCFINNFVENRNIYTQEMALLTTSGFISIDHTFKVTANLGYLMPDGTWVSIYNCLFIALNNCGQVIAWQFTKTTSVDETSELLSSLFQRFQKDSSDCGTIYADNCCAVRNKLKQLFNQSVLVKPDIFHAIQRITRVLSKRHLLYVQVLKDVKLLLRDPRDTGKVRTLPTPAPDVMNRQLDTFITKWKDATAGSKVINDKVLKELQALKGHIMKGCLSNIPPKAGTNRNENLHRLINPYFKRSRMGIPLALALLTILFHRHNQKKTDITYILPARASQREEVTANKQDIYFGIMNKSDLPSAESWIFTKKLDWSRYGQIIEMTNVKLSMDIDLSVEDLVEFCN